MRHPRLLCCFVLLAAVGCTPTARFEQAMYRQVETPDGLEAVAFTASVKTRGLAGEQLIYRVRLLDSQFRPIRSANKRFRDRDGNVAATKALMVFEPSWDFESVTISIPAAELEVEDVEGPITAEFSLLTLDGGVLAVRGVPTRLGKPPAPVEQRDRLSHADLEPPAPPERSASDEARPSALSSVPADAPDLFSLMYDAFQQATAGRGGQDATVRVAERPPVGRPESESAIPEPGPPEPPGQSQNGTDISSDGYNVYEVRSGDTLTSIAKQLYGDTARWIDIFQLNRDRLDSPDLIHEGMLLRMPDTE